MRYMLFSFFVLPCRFRVILYYYTWHEDNVPVALNPSIP